MTESEKMKDKNSQYVWVIRTNITIFQCLCLGIYSLASAHTKLYHLNGLFIHMKVRKNSLKSLRDSTQSDSTG